jgi:hypothetical protein
MSGATPLLPPICVQGMDRDFFFVHNNSFRNPNKGNLQNFVFKLMNITDLFLCHRTKDVTPNMLVLRWKFYNWVWDVSVSNVPRHNVYPDKISTVLFSPSRRISRECLENITTTSITFPIRLSPDIALSMPHYLRSWQFHEIYSFMKHIRPNW